jgi:hypothetical protein
MLVLLGKAMKDKRTQPQVTFDYAKHGWAFCNKEMLGAKIIHLTQLANDLSPDDKRHNELTRIKERFRQWDTT